jgi:hypothetical protein
MKRINVESSSIKSIGYDIITQLLEIEFTRGAIYQYQNVSSLEVVKMLFAESIGSYFAKYIKNNYEFEEIK